MFYTKEYIFVWTTAIVGKVYYAMLKIYARDIDHVLNCTYDAFTFHANHM